MRWSNTKVVILNLCFFFVALVIVVRLFSIQILQRSKYEALAQEQHGDLRELPAKRGNIRSSDGFTLAGVQTHYLMYAELEKIQDVPKTTEVLAQALADIETAKYLGCEKEGEEECKSNFRQEVYLAQHDRLADLLSLDLYWVSLYKGISPEDRELIEQKRIEGVGFEEEPVRFYPEGFLAAHVLGYVAENDEGEKQGYFGVEGKLNGDLEGKPGRVVQEKDAFGEPIILGKYKKIDPVDGRDVILTIDRAVQYLVEKRLKEGVEKYDAVSGSVIVMDPATSSVIAMANFPTYNPRDFSIFEDESDSRRKRVERKNLAVSDIYEPGSVMKPFTISAAVDLGKVTPSSTFVDAGPVRYSDYYIDNWDGKHHGVQTIVELLQKSNNIGAAWVGHLVGAKNLSKYLSDFGFGSPTEIELEGEGSGIIRDYREWTDIDLATISFGQGISATALQVLNGFNSIATGGDLYRPRIVSQIVDGSKIIEMPPKKVRTVISKETAATMTDMLVKAVEGGESKFFNIQDYRIAGKTGTAQIPKEGKYDPNSTNATFVGFLETSKKFSMIVRLDRPSTSVYAAETAVPLWMDIARDLINYYGIPPDRLKYL